MILNKEDFFRNIVLEGFESGVLYDVVGKQRI